MQRKLINNNIRALWLLMVLQFLAACEWSNRLSRIEEDIAALKARQLDESARIQEALQRMWVGIKCTNPRVRDFVEECQVAGSAQGQCSTLNTERALQFMVQEPHVLLRLPTSNMNFDPASEISPLRMGQLLELTHPRNIYPSTRFLIIALPSDETAEEHTKAEVQARRLRNLFNEKFETKSQKNLSILGPLLLPCRRRNELIRLYTTKTADPEAKDFQTKQPQAVVWVFRVDC